MEKINLNLFFRMANIWFVFITLLYSGSQLPHWENVTVHAWVNEAFYFIMFLLSASIFIKSAHNKDIYFNTSLYLLVISFSFIVVFTGESYLIGNDFQAYSFLNYKTMTLCFLLNFIILFTSIRYFLPKMKPWIIYAAVSLILIPLFLIHFYPYLKESDFIFKLGERYREDIQRRVFKTHLSSLAFLVSYGLLLIKTNRTIGTYVHGLMISFTLLLLTDMIGRLSIIYRFNASAISQVIITFNLLILFYYLFQ